MEKRYKKIVILGSSGMLGYTLQNVLKHNYEIIGIDKIKNENLGVKLYIEDLLNFEKIKEIILSEKPDIVINVAAIVSLEVCELNKDIAYKLHVELNKELIDIGKKNNFKYIYISTDSVFDGEKGNYLEEDATNPLNYYAITKLLGEQSVKKYENHIIIRTNIYGYSENQNSLLKWGYNSLKNNKRIKGYTNVFFNPVSVNQLSDAIEILINHDFNGIINVGSNTIFSKYDFLKVVAEYLGKNELLESSFLNDIGAKVERPKNTTLNTEKMENILKKKYILKNEVFRILKEVESENRENND